MKTLKFKTNINCSSCVATVSPFLERIKGAEWKVDTDNKDKILEVSGEDILPENVTKLVREAGFKIELEQFGFFKKLF